MRFPRLLSSLLLLVAPAALAAQRPSAPAPAPARFTHADSLRGGNGPGRDWWDVTFYDLAVRVSPVDSSLRGRVGITYRVLRQGSPGTELQIDLMQPLVVDSIVQDGRALAYRRDGDAFFATVAAPPAAGARGTVTVHYHGKPIAARRPPWDGGLIWARDSLGAPWVATANEGIGASVWWPNKDTWADEPDSQRVAITVPEGMTNISNGRLRRTTPNGDGTTTYEWFVSSPINNYDVAINAGRYTHFTDTYQGERGPLSLDFWALAYHADTARTQFAQARSMLKCFEHWFGPYPWYADGYKLVEAPHLGMEHQSAVAYGNRFRNGYSGRDLSGTGWGMTWDFIIVHESGHEWFGNNVTAKDPADMWVHEGFTNYSEGLYVECQSGKRAGGQYVIGSRRNIRNDAPIVAPYGVNERGSGDMYYKAGSMLHMIRQLVNDDAKWRSILRGIQSTFARRTVTGAEVQAYMSRRAGMDLGPVFAQYLTTTQVPVLEYRTTTTSIDYRWRDVVPGFAMPVRVTLGGQPYRWLHPTAEWQSLRVVVPAGTAVIADPSF